MPKECVCLLIHTQHGQTGVEDSSSPEGLVMKSHFLSGLFQHPLILDPVLQRQRVEVDKAGMNQTKQTRVDHDE